MQQARETEDYNFSNFPGATSGRHGAFCYEAFGSADARTDVPEGGAEFFERYENVGSDHGWILLEYKAIKIKVEQICSRNNIDPATGGGVEHAWWIDSVRVLASSGGFGDGKRRFNVQRGVGATGTNLGPEG